MLEFNTRQVHTVDATAIKRARKYEKEQLRGDKMQGLLMSKGIYIKKDQREFLCAKI